MHRLYKLSAIDINQLLQDTGYSKTYIKNNEYKYHYILTKILDKRRFTTLPDGWVKLNMEGLTKVLGLSKIEGKMMRFPNRIIKDLKEWKIIKYKVVKEKLGDVIVRKSSRAKILDEVIANGYSKWVPNREIPVKEKSTVLTGVYAKMQRSLSMVTVDAVEAKKYALKAKQTRMSLPDKLNGYFLETNRYVNEDVYSSWLMSIEMITDGNYWVYPEFVDGGRCYTAVTSFPKKMRNRFVMMNGVPMVELDCSSSQPLLFGVYLRQHYELTDDMKHYISLCETGTFYDYLKEALLEQGETVNDDTFKGSFFSKVFYSTEKVNYKWRRIFAEHFPNVSAAITTAKKGHPKNLSSQLSLLESDIMINGVASKLYAAGIYEFLTLHDCILTIPEHYDTVRRYIITEYEERGVTPNINQPKTKLN